MTKTAGQEIIESLKDAVQHAELLSCPFCGGEAKVQYDYLTSSVRCSVCKIQTEHMRSDTEAKAKWNTRISGYQPFVTAKGGRA